MEVTGLAILVGFGIIIYALLRMFGIIRTRSSFPY